MPLIHFVETKESEKNKCLCYWVESFYLKGRKIQVMTSEIIEAQNLDHLLWVFSQKSFVPHEVGCPEEADPLTPVYIVTETKKIPGFDVLVMSTECPLDYVAQFTESVHFVCMDNDAHRKRCRQYWLEARKRGFELKHHRYRPLAALKN